MGIKSIGAGLAAKLVHRMNQSWIQNPISAQERLFKQLIAKGTKTRFGRDHGFSEIRDYSSFKSSVPIRDYEGLRPYVDQIIAGHKDVLWPGRPLYFSKTSGTTSGVKYIPIVKDAMPCYINAARDVLLNYVYRTGNSSFFDGKMIFLSGSPEMEKTAGILTGRLSGIVNHFIPFWLKGNQLPTYATNCIEDWEQKVAKIMQETSSKDMRLISGIPPWMQMYFDLLIDAYQKPVGDLFPNLSVISHGGVNFEPYKEKLFASIGRNLDTLETFPASEGFFAYQDVPDGMKEKEEDNGLLLLANNGVFFEFVPVSEFYNENPSRYSLADIELGVDYVLVLNTNSGLWAYNIGDTVRFVSKNPHRIIVSGRLKHFISAFGEHVIGKEVDTAISQTSQELGVKVIDFTVAPMINPDNGLPFHEWFVEFDGGGTPDIKAFAALLDKKMCIQNIYYKDLIEGGILKPLQLRPMQKHAFIDYMRSIGKLGGQNKLPRLSNDRNIADAIVPYILK